MGLGGETAIYITYISMIFLFTVRFYIYAALIVSQFKLGGNMKHNLIVRCFTQ